MTTTSDVIIIGAGSAGLSAAKALTAQGLSCTVLEGAHRIGGRAYSEEIAPGVWFDLGCSWLVGGADNPFTPIADQHAIALGKDTEPVFRLNQVRFHRNGAELTEAERTACLQYYADTYADLSAASKAPNDSALSDVIDIEHEFAPPLLGGISTSWGLDADHISTFDNNSSEGGLGYPVLHGYGNLVAHWGADVPVTLNAPVTSIDWSHRTVRVETPKGTASARALLSTVSTGILGSGEIRFVPKLPEWKAQAIAALPMGTENKIGLHFDRDVFGAQGRGYYSTWNNAGDFAKVNACPMGLNLAMVFMGGRQGIWLEKQGPAACTAFAIDRVADIFGNDIRKRVTASIPTAWNGDAWTRGSWACAQPGAPDPRTALARSVDDRLFFAGEATSIGGQGTCHGAYLSGIRAAHEIAKVIGTPTQSA